MIVHNIDQNGDEIDIENHELPPEAYEAIEKIRKEKRNEQFSIVGICV